MDIVLVSDNRILTHELEPLLREAVGSEPVVITGKCLIKGTPLPPADVVLVDRKTWQEYYTLFHYFGVLSYFDRSTLVCVSRGRQCGALKGRLNCKDLSLTIPSPADVTRRILDDARELSEKRASENY